MIDPVEVSHIFKQCLYRDAELQEDCVPRDAIIIEGVTASFGLNPDRVQQHRVRIMEILGEVSPDFSDPKAGGTSFLNLPMDKDGVQWGEHKNAQELMVLGMAVDAFEYLGPKDMWAILPGGMPYLKLTLEG